MKKGIRFVKAKVLILLLALCVISSQLLPAFAIEIIVPPIPTAGEPDPVVNIGVENLSRSDGTNEAGDLLKFTATITNDGDDSTWYDVFLYISLGEGLDISTAHFITLDGTVVSGSDDPDSDLISVELSDINGYDTEDNISQDVHVVNFYASINKSGDGQSITTSALATGFDGAGDPIDDSDEVIVNVKHADPVCSIEKTWVNNTNTIEGSNVVGDEITYNITMSNSSEIAVWSNVVLTDTIPTYVDFESDAIVYLNGTALSSSEYSYDAATRVLTVQVGDIGGDSFAGTMMVSFTVTIDESAFDPESDTTFYNTATATGDESTVSDTDDGLTVTSKDPTSENAKTVRNVSNIVEGKTVVGDTLEYTITLKNTTLYSVWKDVVVVDPLPEEVDFDQAGGVQINGTSTNNYTYNDHTLSIEVGNIVGGDTVEITFQVVLNTKAYGKTVKNVAYVEDEKIPGPGVETDSYDPNPYAEKVVDNLTSTDGYTRVNDTLKYTITVSNLQQFSNWINVTVYDTIPRNVTFDASTLLLNGNITSYTYNESTRVLEIYLGDLEYIDEQPTYVIEFQATVDSDAYGQDITNTAKVIGDNGDKDIDDGGNEVIDKLQPPIIETSKTTKPDTGDSMYTLLVIILAMSATSFFLVKKRRNQ